jgi:hypothetical protein
MGLAAEFGITSNFTPIAIFTNFPCEGRVSIHIDITCFFMGRSEVMGLFSKFNIKAVDQAYKDLMAVQFTALVSVKILDACEHSGTGLDIGPICDEVALMIGQSLDDNADGGLEFGAAMQRLDIVSSSIKRDLIIKFGHDHRGVEISNETRSMFGFISPKLIKAAKRGYLKMSIMDAARLIEIYEVEVASSLIRFSEKSERYVAEFEDHTEAKNAEQPHDEEQFLAEVDRQYEEAGIGTPSHHQQSPKEFIEQLYKTVGEETAKVEAGKDQPSPHSDSGDNEAVIVKKTVVYSTPGLSGNNEKKVSNVIDTKNQPTLASDSKNDEVLILKREDIYSSELAVTDIPKKEGNEDGSSAPKLRGEFEQLQRENREGARAQWLRGEWESLQKKRANGRQLDSYELGLEKKYVELQTKK